MGSVPRAQLQPARTFLLRPAAPGECWEVRDEAITVVVRVACPVALTAVSIEHSLDTSYTPHHVQVSAVPRAARASHESAFVEAASL